MTSVPVDGDGKDWAEPRPSTGSHQTIIQIYLDWANHYLQKGRSTRRIQDLEQDLRDGVIIADVVQAITNQRVPGLMRKPKSAVQMLENLDRVLLFLAGIGVSLDGIQAGAIRDGQLRPILRLFFELSRYRQKDMPIPQAKREKAVGKGSSIPVLGNLSTPTKKTSLQPGTVSGGSSRSTSPLAPTPHSLIPMPRSGAAQPPPRIIPERESTHASGKLPSNSQEKNSMLQKLRVFKDRGPNSPSSSATTGANSKRTSSSSGFSSAKSDSSIVNESKGDPPPPILQKQEAQKNHSEPQLKKKTDKGNNGVAASSESLPTNGNPSSFLRNPRTLSTNKDSRLRYSATGIPTRPANVNNNHSVSTTIAPPTNHIQPNTLIPQPKPTAAVKGHTKPLNQSNTAVEKSSQLQKKRVRPESGGVEALQSFAKKELKAIVAPMPPTVASAALRCPSEKGLESTAVIKEPIKPATEKPDAEDWEDDEEVFKDLRPMEPLSLQRKSAYAPLGSPPFVSQPTPQDPLIEMPRRDFTFNGFLSDTGTGSRQQKFKEESYEDLSSLSNGISEINGLPEDSLVSDLSTSPYASLRRLGKEEGRHRVSSHNHITGLDEELDPPEDDELTAMTGVREEFPDPGRNGRGDEWSRRSKLSFGYVRTTTPLNGGTSLTKASMQQGTSHQPATTTRLEEPKIANHVSLSQRPPPHLLPSTKGKTRTRVKVSGGTQTTNDLSSTQDYVSLQSVKSMSLTSPTAAQLSESLRQRILLGSHSLPKGASADYAAILASIQQQQHQLHQHRLHHQQQHSQQEECHRRVKDRRYARESPYAIYAELKETYAQQSPSRPSSSPYVSSVHTPSSRLHTGGSLTEAESMESLNSTSSAATHGGREPRTRSRASAQTCCQAREQSPSGLNRSNSIRSTKSEKIYPSMLHRTDDPLAIASRNHTDASSVLGTPTRAAGSYGGGSGQKTQPLRLSMSPYATFGPVKDDEINGSSLSLVSTASSIYSTTEEKQAHELRKVRRELHENQEKSTRSTTSSLLMPPKLPPSRLSSDYSGVPSVKTAVHDGFATVRKRKGPTCVSLASSTHPSFPILPPPETNGTNPQFNSKESLRRRVRKFVFPVKSFPPPAPSTNQRLHPQSPWRLTSSVSEKSIANSPEEVPWRQRKSLPWWELATRQQRHRSLPLLEPNQGREAHVVAAFEQSLANMTHRLQTLTLSAEQKDSELMELRQTIEVLRKQSIEAGLILPRLTSGVSRDGSPIGRQLSADSVSSINSISSATSSHSQTSAPLQQPPINSRPRGKGWLRSSFSKAFSRSKGGKGKEEESKSERETSGVDITSKWEPQPPSCGEEKERSVDELRKQLREKEMVLTDIRLEALTSAHQLESLKETMAKMRGEMVSLRQENERLQRMVSGKCIESPVLDRVNGESFIDVELASPGEKEGKRVMVVVSLRHVESLSEVSIGKVSVSARTKWDLLDSLVRRTFKEYVCRVDPVSGLGLSPDSILSYAIGEIIRSRERGPPELLPCGYLVGDVNKIRVTLKGAADGGGSVDALAFQTLLHKHTLLRWVACLSESRTLLLSGVRGVGKSFLAHRLAEFLVSREGKDPSPEVIPTFSADGRGAAEIEEYLGLWTEELGTGDFPSVLIIENLQESIREPFAKAPQKPYVIATTTLSPSETSLRQIFRCVELNPCTEPLRGLVGRFLEQRLIEAECNNLAGVGELGRIFHWIPLVFAQINEQLVKCGQIPIGPRLFLSCPMDEGAEMWFTNLWNKNLRPQVIEALYLHSGEPSAEELVQFITMTFPWPSTEKILH